VNRNTLTDNLAPKGEFEHRKRPALKMPLLFLSMKARDLHGVAALKDFTSGLIGLPAYEVQRAGGALTPFRHSIRKGIHRDSAE
jgi:hypothetical protein